MSEENEGIDNTTAVTRILAGNDLEAVKMILGDRDRITPGGVVRPGIKVPLASTTAKEKEIYEKMYAAGEDFDTIDAAMGGSLPVAGKPGTYTKSKLRPSNCRQFRVCASDFRNPAYAAMIMDKYADPTDHLLYQIPIWFPVGDLHLVLPHGYRSFSSDGSLKSYSEFDANGNLICHYIPLDEQTAAREEKRRPQFLTRPCDSLSCASHKKKHCDFGGLLKFNIPGVKSMGGIIMPTTSINGLSEIMASLKSLLNPDLLGRFSGLFQNDTFLILTKIHKEVSTPDGSRQMQWLPTIDFSVDSMELACYAEPSAVAARASNALRSLTGQRCAPAPIQGPRTLNEVRAAEDLPPLVDNAEPATPTVEPGAEAAHQEPGYDFTAARDALKALIEPHALSLGEMSIYAASQGMGTGLADMTKAEMTTFFKHVRLALHTDAPSFIENVRKIAGTDDATEMF